MFDFASALAKAAKVVHDTFKVQALYYAPGSLVSVTLGVRWHDKATLVGNIVETGYADVIEGIDRVIFDRDELALKSVVLERSGRVVLGPVYNNAVLCLDAEEKANGPVNVTWKVVQ